MTEPTSTEPTSIDVRDPGPLRALANPVRLRLLGMLRVDGPATVGQLAERSGEAAGSVSYHLQTLAKHGFVVEVPELARDRRERWWQAVHDFTHVGAESAAGDPERRDASEAMRRAVLDSYHRELLDALEAELTLEPEWIEASDSSDIAAHLTLDEFRELAADLAAVRDKWFARGRDRRDGTRTVRLITHAFPRVER
ncbi:ArsR family transcriptional regulator [Agromyces protaetiae]|uniref:ArsR family transcriptional regulator n=1 Tax=Agromyces protaetiae TaxID=2509455 RepID=A0A4P6FEN9_9MICO|nr:helix-turn-helix domain-containing protein [Agromyces protaetiae]QAY74750.1 ArsR family transcriptional regulator [Agromyces protaetiae]